MKDVTIQIKAQEKASRIELLIRFVYLIPLYIVLMVLSLIAIVGIVINFLTSLILGKRIGALNKFVVAYLKYSYEFSAYLFVTDERPEIIPKI
ncbi:MAG: DUF4389 domain-containing protein [archaeon]|nr:DUF4389 domain-containing protein [archaeon]